MPSTNLRLDGRQLLRVIAVAGVSLVAATLVVAVLESRVGVPNASIVYLAAVVAAAFVAGTAGAVVTAVGSFLAYDYFFTLPYHTLTITDPGEWLSVILLLVVGTVVGQLAALQRSRASEASAREREAMSLFRISRALATRRSTPAALETVAGTLLAETRMTRVWIVIEQRGREQLVADTGGAQRPPRSNVVGELQRMPGDEPARWQRIHHPSAAGGRKTNGAGVAAYRVRIERDGRVLGSIWSLREHAARDPDRTETRLLALAADQTGQSLANDRLAEEARDAEVMRQSNEIKSALLQSVSHDLRTPLATIRAAAGTMRPRNHPRIEDQEDSADAIEREVEYLNRLVTNLLDLSRIDAGALRVDRDVFELDDVVSRTLERLAPRLGARRVDADLEAPPVVVDAILLDEAVTNLLDNAIKYTPESARIVVLARALDGSPLVRLTIEDAGPGVPTGSLPRLFEKFYQVPGVTGGSRSGTGIGLAVVRGLVLAMDGRVEARRSELGGLAIDIDLPRAEPPAELDEADLR
jgi:two-component system sensor histidine kinase KdpD